MKPEFLQEKRVTSHNVRWTLACDDRSGAETSNLRALSGLEKKRPIGVPPISLFFQSARRESNPRPPPWQGGAPPLSHSRIVLRKIALTRTSDILSHVPIKVNTIIILFFSYFFLHGFSHLTHNCELSLSVSHTAPQALSHPNCNW